MINSNFFLIIGACLLHVQPLYCASDPKKGVFDRKILDNAIEIVRSGKEKGCNEDTIEENKSIIDDQLYYAAAQNIIIEGLDFTKVEAWGLQCKNLQIPKANFTDATFQHLDLSGYKAGEANLEEGNFTNVKVSKFVNFKNAKLKKTKFIGIVCSRVTYKGADLSLTDFSDATLGCCTDFRYATVQKAELPGLLLNCANLMFTDFTGSNLRGVIFNQCVFRRTDLSYTDLVNAKFKGNVSFDLMILKGAFMTYKQVYDYKLDVKKQRFEVLKANLDKLLYCEISFCDGVRIDKSVAHEILRFYTGEGGGSYEKLTEYYKFFKKDPKSIKPSESTLNITPPHQEKTTTSGARDPITQFIIFGFIFSIFCVYIKRQSRNKDAASKQKQRKNKVQNKTEEWKAKSV